VKLFSWRKKSTERTGAKTSLLRRILVTQALVIGLLFLLTLLLNLSKIYQDDNPNFSGATKLQMGALMECIKSESDPARIPIMARQIQQIDETYSKDENLKPGEYKAYYQILNRDGAMIFRTSASPLRPFTDKGPGFYVVKMQNYSWRVTVQDVGSYRVLVAESLWLRRSAFWRSQKGLLLGFSVIYLFMALGTWPVVRRILRPLRDLARNMETRPAGDLSPIRPPVDIREVRPLVQALNGMMERLGSLLESQRRFTADAAHELRTPLAVVGTQVHALTHCDDDVERQLLAEDLQRGLERATGVVRQLLTVARMDGAEPRLQLRKLNLEALAKDRVSLVLGLALGKKQDLGLEVAEGLEWVVDAAVLGTAIDNLLENAIRYCPEGSTITLRIQRQDTGLLLEVEDDGPGIHEHFRPHAFKRFSRAPGNPSPGTGLGLSIVQRAAELHRGKVGMRVPPSGKGLIVYIQLEALKRTQDGRSDWWLCSNPA